MPANPSVILEPSEKKKRGRPRRLNVGVTNPNEGVFVGRRLNTGTDATSQNLASSPTDSTIQDTKDLTVSALQDDNFDIEDGLSSEIEGNFLGSSSPSEFMSETDLANALRSPDQRISRSARESLERAIVSHTEHIQNLNTSNKWYDTNAEYTSKLLEYFMAPDDAITELPDFILNPPKGVSFDQVIDEEGNTAFHWACSMGNAQAADAWIKLGANYRAVNNQGETALMRAVTFANSYTQKTFPKLIEILSETIFEFDSTHRTVLHHIAAAATTRSRVPSSLYYMDILLAKIAESQPPERLEGFLNLQDNNGDCALHICARNANRKCIKLLLEYKANHSLKNNSGLTPSVLLLDNENLTPKVHQRYETHLRNQKSLLNNAVPEPHISEAAIEATHKVSTFLVESLNELSNAYDNELQRKEADVLEVKELLSNMDDDIRLTKLKTKEYLGEDLSEDRIQEKIRQLDDQVQRAEDLVRSKETRLRELIERSQVKSLNNLYQKHKTSSSLDSSNSSDPLINAIELSKLQLKRKKYIEQIIEYHGGLNESNEKMQKYRRLISACSDVKIDQVNDKVDELLNEIEESMS